jgi:hypothetical protein
LTNADFYYDDCSFTCRVLYTRLFDVDLTAADARGALLRTDGAITTNLIHPEGHISGLDLDAGGLLDVRDYDGYPGSSDYYSGYFRGPIPPLPITIDEHLAMGSGGTLRIVFEADAWDSTISFAPGIPVTLGGTLELTFAADVNPASQVGRTFNLFNWTGVTPTGAFTVSSPYAWDVSNLYATGEVMLIAIPEPTNRTKVISILIASAAWLVPRARKDPKLWLSFGHCLC